MKKPLRLLVVADSAAKYFSVHVRAGQYGNLFSRCDSIQADFVSRRSEEFERWIGRFQVRVWGKGIANTLRRINRRVIRKRESRILQKAAGYDLAYVVKVPDAEFHLKLCKLPTLKVVMDVNDALWLPHHYIDGYTRVEDMFGASDALFCENSFLLNHCKASHPQTYLVPDCPQSEVFESRRSCVKRSADRMILGWVGSPRTADALYRVFEPLELLFQKHSHLHLRIVGATSDNLPRFEKVRFSCRASYGQAEMVEEMLGFHIGLFPLFDVEDSLVRGNLKAKLYMAGGCAAVCQDLGENRTLINNWKNGVLAGTSDQWLSSLDRLIEHPKELEAIAESGLTTIREKFTVDRCFETLRNAFMAVSETPKRVFEPSASGSF